MHCKQHCKLVLKKKFTRKPIPQKTFALLVNRVSSYLPTGQRESQINRATGEANAILAKAKARAEAIDLISNALNQQVRFLLLI